MIKVPNLLNVSIRFRVARIDTKQIRKTIIKKGILFLSKDGFLILQNKQHQIQCPIESLLRCSFVGKNGIKIIILPKNLLKIKRCKNGKEKK